MEPLTAEDEQKRRKEKELGNPSGWHWFKLFR